MSTQQPTGSTQQSSGEPSGFEQSLAALEQIVRDLEEGKIPLSEALARYEQGVKLLRQCYQLLEHAERRISLLTRVTPEGEAIVANFEDAAASLDEKASTRSKRRSHPAEPPAKPCAEGSAEPRSGQDVDVPGGLF